MATGLLALLDDVAVLTRAAAASLDDVAAAAAKAGAKAAGVVIDDAAVTPRYVVGFSAAREIPIVWKIAVGSLRNKLLILLPAALLLSWLAPWAITPILMLGGLYLCYEGAEKVVEALFHASKAAGTAAGDELGAAAFEDQQVKGAIATDFILSAEIMAITLATVTHFPFVTRALVLGLVGLGLTVLVYGAVALIVKADDFGVSLAQGARTGLGRAFGRGLVKGMPYFLSALSVIGTAAMIWVGGGILLHGAEELGWPGPAHLVHAFAVGVAGAVPLASGVIEWLVTALASGVLGMAAGGALIPIVGLFHNKGASH